MKKNKIWLIANKSEVGGGETFQLDLAKGLESKGWHPLLLIPNDGRFSNLAKKNNIKYVTGWFKEPFQQSFSSLIIYSFLLFIKMLINKPKIIYANSTAASRVFMIGAKILKIPVICHIHCTDPENVKTSAAWEYKHIPSPQKLIYVSEYNKNEYQATYQSLYPNLQQTVIHNGVKDQYKKTTININSPIKIGYVANFEVIKGHEDLIAAAKILKTQNYEFEIHLYGDDLRNENRKALLIEKIKKNSLEKNFILHGFVNNVFEHLSQLNIYICASRQEAFPLSILEAMSVPLAIITTDVGGIPEMIEDNTNGILIPANCPQIMAKKLGELINNNDLQKTLASNARATFSKKFNNIEMLNKIHLELELSLL